MYCGDMGPYGLVYALSHVQFTVMWFYPVAV